MNNFNKLPFFFILICLCSCSLLTRVNYKTGLDALDTGEEKYRYKDKGSRYVLKKQTTLNSKNKTYTVKRVLESPTSSKGKVVEQSIAISNVGFLKKTNKTVLRPNISQFNIWFDGKKYSSELKINSKNRSVQIKMNSPESQWNGVENVQLPAGDVLPCYFSQIIECAKATGFIKTASTSERGIFYVNVIWEGYPYISEVYSNFPNEAFSSAELEYDGMLNQKERRFNLRVAGQSIFYILNEKDELTKMFWVSEGVTMIHNKLPLESSERNEGEGFE